ncbi:MAG: hypothetical protein FWF38_06660, partial [Spirochaetaceae bacterium]|nr:hypothetical protein [Spirochaetaceae bacterium]
MHTFDTLIKKKKIVIFISINNSIYYKEINIIGTWHKYCMLIIVFSFIWEVSNVSKRKTKDKKNESGR